MRILKIMAVLATFIICFGCKSTVGQRQIEQLRKENEDLRANLVEAQKQISYKDTIIENLKKQYYKQKPILSLPTTEELKIPATFNIKTVSSALKKQNFYGVKIKNNNTLLIIIAKNVFQSGSDKLTKKGINDIKKLTHVLNKYKPKSIDIKGYTDNTSLSYATASKFMDNYGLSVARAKQAKAVILKYLKFKSNKISIEGLGEEKPLTSNKTKSGRDINRRLEIYLYY